MKKVRLAERGITLIALVITIIVLLILTQVSLSILLGDNGLLTKAEKAKIETKAASVEEAKKIWVANIEMDKLDGTNTAQTLTQLLDDLENQNLITKNERKIIENEGQITIGSKTISFREASITDISKIEVGQYVQYEPTKLDISGKINVDSDLLQYVSHKGGYKDGKLENGNGYGDQVVTAKPLSKLKWKILEKDGDNVILISENTVKTDANTGFYLQGSIGYLYAEQELHEACKIYGYGYGADTSMETNYTIGGPFDEKEKIGTIKNSGARSIMIEDLDKAAKVGEKVNGTTVTTSYKDTNSQYGSKEWPTTEVYYPTLENFDANYPGRSLDMKKNFESTFYYYNKSKITDQNVCDMFFNGEYYWFASRCINSVSQKTAFCVRHTISRPEDSLLAFDVCRYMRWRME